ncbi:MAG TPA: PhzF family phenazine biosynthesis protein [Chthoniobacterales bacterium]
MDYPCVQMQEITVIDAFAAQPFSGNPAAVCLLDEPREDRWMQLVAREMNLPETAFLEPDAGGDVYRLRWFTPTVEVRLCGHATLASAHLLWEKRHLPPEAPARFHTLSGLLTATRQRDGWIQLDLPAEAVAQIDPPPGLAESLSVKPIFVGRTPAHFFIEVATEREVRQIQPDFTWLRSIAPGRVIVTSQADPGSGYDVVSRYFAPGVGVDEDPVTGSAHCALAPYWEPRLGRRELQAYQASARGGTLRMKREGTRVLVSGQALTIWEGRLFPS